MKERTNENLTLLIRPIGACNHNCIYCFDKEWHKDFQIIDKDLLISLMHKACSEFTSVTWTWHGGECTLVGKEWFKEMNWNLQKIAHIYGTNLAIGAQTNGTLLDDEWLQIFDTYRISYGVSFDGSCAQKFQRGYDFPEYLYNKAYSTISVITKYNIDHLIDIYEECKKMPVMKQMSYNFVFDTNHDKNMLGDMDYAIQKYKEFIDYYLYDPNPEGVSERTTIQWICMALGKGSQVCLYKNCMEDDRLLCITRDGNIWNCDTTYHKDFFLGNVADYDKIGDVFVSEQYTKLVELKYHQEKDECLYCPYNPICAKGCLGNALTESGFDADHLKPYELHCRMIKTLIPYLYEKLKDLTPEEMLALNPVVKRELISRSYLPLSLKKLAWEEAEQNV